MKFTAEELMARLPLPATDKWKDGVWDVEALRKGGVSFILFAPRGADHQTFHDQDELYFIISGTGELVIAGQRHDFKPGDAFFVEAGVEHRFENFSEDLATWAVFF